MKVFELAKECNIPNNELIEFLNDSGYEIKSHLKQLTEEQVALVKATMNEDIQPTDKLKAKSTDIVAQAIDTVANTKPVKTDADYRPDEMIPCRSVFAGVLIFSGSHTGMTYTFNGIGDRRNIEYQDLKAGMLQQKSSLYNPDIIIEDDNLINDEHWIEIKDVYDKMYNAGDYQKILSLPTPKFREEFTKLPITAKNVIKTIVATEIDNGTFESLNKAKIIDEICGTNFDIKMSS